MQLKDLEQYDLITIQCHDNPDADAIGAGFGLYHYFTKKGKEVRLIYSGRNKIQKPNLILLVEKLEIPIEYVKREEAIRIKGLLITVDCQYGAGNVTKLEADAVAIIDHHQEEISGIAMTRIQPNLGSCSTLVWKMMEEMNFQIEDTKVGTGLYYGLYIDTNQFAELHSPLDMDMKDSLPFTKSLISMFRNSNLSLKELEIAGIAMLRYIYNSDYKFAVIHSQPCDPNILGLISDFLLQVDQVDTCLVYNETEEGFKLSIRSCIKEVNAGELAAYLTKGMGSGGGHYDKSGGFISLKLYEAKYPTLNSEAFMSNKLTEYFDSTDIIETKEYEIELSDMGKYQKKKIPLGYVKASEILPVGTPITIRTLEGDVDMIVDEELYIIIGVKGEVYPNTRAKFEGSYQELEETYCIENCTTRTDYIPTIKNRITGQTMIISDYAKSCISTGKIFIYAKPLVKRVKVFTAWDEEKYMLGTPGDYLAVRCDDFHDIYIIEKEVFDRMYDVKEVGANTDNMDES